VLSSLRPYINNRKTKTTLQKESLKNDLHLSTHAARLRHSFIHQSAAEKQRRKQTWNKPQQSPETKINVFGT
jgi:hypothetical protein